MNEKLYFLLLKILNLEEIQDLKNAQFCLTFIQLAPLIFFVHIKILI